MFSLGVTPVNGVHSCPSPVAGGQRFTCTAPVAGDWYQDCVPECAKTCSNVASCTFTMPNNSSSNIWFCYDDNGVRKCDVQGIGIVIGSIGGVPVDRFALLFPYIGLAAVVAATMVVAAVYMKRIRNS